MIRDRFRAARSALDQKNVAQAEPLLVEARLMIAEAEKLGVNDDGLGDLSALVDGFLQLMRFTADQPASTKPAAAITGEAAAAIPPAAAALGTVEPSPAPRAGGAPRVYTGYDPDVTPPVVVDQRMPPMVPELRILARSMNRSAVLDIVIDENGGVLEAILRQSMNPIFDNLLVDAARRWKYRPAIKDGVPVRFTKTLTVLP
jgi:TonB family protein